MSTLLDADTDVIAGLDEFEPQMCEMYRCRVTNKPAHAAAWFAVKTCGCHRYSCEWPRENRLSEDGKVKCGFCDADPVEAEFMPIDGAR